MAEKIYVPGSSVKTHVFSDGGKVLNLSFKVAELRAFMDQHANDGGYLNLQLQERKNGPSEYGHTHSVSLNTWTPKKDAAKVEEPW